MDATGDELAGVVELFGGLTREELQRALRELAFRDDGASLDETEFERTLEAAIETYTLVSDDRPTDTLFVAGPTAFPTTPAHAEDLPHILDVDRRDLDREAIGEQVVDRFTRDVTVALATGDETHLQWLLDVSYDVEAWGPIDLTAQRSRLDNALEH